MAKEQQKITREEMATAVEGSIPVDILDRELAALKAAVSELSKTWQPFSINHTVRVKLNDTGRAHYATTYMKDVPIREDADGWSTWQLWTLFELFGPAIYLGCFPPFETTIELQLGPC